MNAGDKCTKCNRGTMVERDGPYGPFLGCSNFPRCRNKGKIAKSSSEPRSDSRRYDFEPPAYTPIDLDKLILSHYQKAIIDAFLNTKDNIICRSSAGSGKSTMLRILCQLTDSDASVMYATFDKRSTEDITGKLPPHVTISTWHSYGLRQIKRVNKHVRVNQYKVLDIIAANLETESDFYTEDVIRQARFDIARLISTAKNNLYLPHDIIPWEDIADASGIALNGNADLIVNYCQSIFLQSLQDTSQVDYDDMIYFPAAGLVPIAEVYNLLLGDETQDLNRCQIVLAKAAGKRAIIVGDENQAIYLFRGADSESMNRLESHFSARRLPLSICYRCGTDIIAAVNNKFPDIPIEPFAENERGRVTMVDYSAMLDSVLPGDNILCRTNAPLVEPCFHLIRDGKKAIILGREIGKELINVVRKMSRRANSQSMDDILTALSSWTNEQVTRLTNRGNEAAAGKFIDQRDTIVEISLECDSLSEFESLINKIFSDDREGIILSTVHKSKGSEADHVYILRPDLMPMSRGDPQEEKNIQYVAMTRAIKSLSFVDPDSH